MLRTHTCGELRSSHIQQEVKLCGWVHCVRNAGTLLWIELRDRYGRTQLICEKGKTPAAAWRLAQALGREDVLQAQGKVLARKQSNAKLPTGEIELQVGGLQRLSTAEVPPFLMDEETDGGELLRLEHRYLDLRRIPLQKNLHLRHQLCRVIRNFLDERAFIEVETPMLIKSTPEGARDFVVPSRLHKNQYYALPQSPQIFKQLLMVGGMDRYYQLARCFRDEDHRADRQPEFTQLDCEMSFVSMEDILKTFEALMVHVFLKIKNYRLPQPFPRLPYAEVTEKYGTDKPDIRYKLPLFSLKEGIDNPDFPLFSENEAVMALLFPQGASRSARRQLDAWRDLVCSPQLGAQGLAYLRVGEKHAHDTPLKKHFSQQILQKWVEATGAAVGDLLLFIAGPKARAAAASSVLRSELAATHQLYDPASYQALWVLNFPLFKQNSEDKSLQPMHHPFTAPLPEDIPRLGEQPLQARAASYDLIINGTEIGGGSLRISSAELQTHVLALLGLSAQEIEAQFGFLLRAFRYGVPPHGGIAMGLDRLTALLAGPEQSIRDCIAFPKNTAGRDLMLGAPSILADENNS